MNNVWPITLAVLGVLSMFSVLYSLIRSGLKQKTELLSLEYKIEKERAKDEAAKDSIDTVVDRINSRINERK